MKSIWVMIATLLYSTAIFAVAPTNPSLEDTPDLDGWIVLNDGDFGGAGYVVRGEDATDGDAFGRLSFADCCTNGFATGPAFLSPTFSAGTGEEISLDWRATALGGWCTGDLGAGDTATGVGYLMDASDDTIAETFFDLGPTCDVPWDTASVIVPGFGDYYVLVRVGSYDETGGGVIGAQLDVDNIISSNLPPDCTGAEATPAKLWPPNHTFRDIEIVGVTDPDGDAFTINVDSVFQDEWTNSADDGDTCPDATGIGTDTASVRAERVGGEIGSEGDGRVYWIYFTATDVFGATCSDIVKVRVPHDKKTPAVDAGPLFDSTSCP